MLKCSTPGCKNEGLFEVGYDSKTGTPILVCYECWHKDTPDIIKDNINKTWKKLLFYSKRHKLVKLFEKWCKENNADENDKTNLVSWLHLMGLLDVDKVEKYLKNRSK